MANTNRLSIAELCSRTETVLRTRHYSRSTITSYVFWLRKFLERYWYCPVEDLGETEITAFLSDLAIRQNVAASTQNQALSAVLFFFKQVLGRELEWMNDVARARRSQHLPVVLSRQEVQRILGRMQGTTLLVAELLYGSGLRLMECLRLRVKDIDFDQRKIVVRDGKGKKDRVTVLPARAEPRLRQHLSKVRRLHAKDLLAGAGFVELPHALARKYPNAASSWPYQWVFPRPAPTSTRPPASADGTTFTRPSFRRQYGTPSAPPGSPSRPAATASGTVSRLICSRMALTSERFRNSSATATSARR